MDNALILVVEDEPQIAEILQAYLEREGFRTLVTNDGQNGLMHHARLRPDLVILDVSLPGLDGWQVLSSIRRRGDTPVIMVTALSDDIDKIQALRSGADDYVVKPFNPIEVVARTRAVLRRFFRKGDARTLRIGPLAVDPEARLASVESGDGRRTLDLTPTEFRILHHMASFPRRAFERGELVDACLPESDALDRTVDSHMSNLRRKLAAAGAPHLLAAVRGVGYRLGGADV